MRVVLAAVLSIARLSARDTHATLLGIAVVSAVVDSRNR
jgi:hypothetical protein